MFTVPADTPVTVPEDAPTVARAVLLLLHVPPTDPLLSVVELPVQTSAPPVDAPGVATTVTTAVLAQPDPSV